MRKNRSSGRILFDCLLLTLQTHTGRVHVLYDVVNDLQETLAGEIFRIRCLPQMLGKVLAVMYRFVGHKGHHSGVLGHGNVRIRFSRLLVPPRSQTKGDGIFSVFDPSARNTKEEVSKATSGIMRCRRWYSSKLTLLLLRNSPLSGAWHYP